jgi:hypothetical protein
MGQVRLSSSIAPRLEIVGAHRKRSCLLAPSRTDATTCRDPAGGVVAYSRAEGERYWMDLPGLATFCFDERSDHVVAAPYPGIAADAVAEHYWHSALPLVVQAPGGEVLHASGVLMSRGVVALCGASKSGKSTIAYGLHRRGYRLWADDAVALAVTEPAITALSLPFDVRLRSATAAFFGLGERAAVLAGSDNWSEPMQRAPTPLEAVLILDRRRGAPSSEILAPLKGSVAYPALLANAYCFSLQEPARKRLMLDRYLSLVTRVRVAALAVPDGLEGLAAMLDELERAFGEPSRDVQ